MPTLHRNNQNRNLKRRTAIQKLLEGILISTVTESQKENGDGFGWTGGLRFMCYESQKENGDVFLLLPISTSTS